MKIHVIGVYLSDRPNTHDHLVEAFGSSKEHIVNQSWIEMTEDTKQPKYTTLNSLLYNVDEYDFVIVTDDDTRLEDDWLDSFIGVQHELGFALAQPALTHNSHHSYDFNLRHYELLARETLFVEIGPLFSVARSAYPHIFPFDKRSPEGWGYDLIWPYRLRQEHLRMGVIDAYPIDHSFRPQGLTYDYGTADSDRNTLLAEEPHMEKAECQVEIKSYPLTLMVPD